MALSNQMIRWAMGFLLLATVPAALANDGLTARNKAIVTDFYTTVMIGRNVDAAPRFLSTEYIQHSGTMASGRKAFMDLFRANFAHTPPSDYKREILRVVGDNDIVIIFNRQSGTDEKGHHLVLQFDMFRVQDGMIVEHWDADT